MITTQEILAYLESGQSFSMKVVAYDRKRKKGGEIKYYPEAILVQKTENKPTRPPTKIEQQKTELEQLKKDPHHKKWYTRNIQILQNGFPVGITHTIHPPLIIEFNGDTQVVP